MTSGAEAAFLADLGSSLRQPERSLLASAVPRSRAAKKILVGAHHRPRPSARTLFDSSAASCTVKVRASTALWS